MTASTKTYVIIENEIETFHDENKLKKFIINKPAQDKMFEESFRLKKRINTPISQQERGKHTRTVVAKQIGTTKAQNKQYKVNKVISTNIHFSVILNINDLNSPMQKHRLAHWIKKKRKLLGVIKKHILPSKTD